MKIVILGLSITSSWGNGHATTYRSLMRELVRRGHHVLFLERDQPWYAQNRDLPQPPFGRTELYNSVRDLKSRFSLEYAWSGDRVDFERPGVSGSMHVTKEQIRLDVALSFLLTPLKPAIEKEIHVQLDRLLGPAGKSSKSTKA